MNRPLILSLCTLILAVLALAPAAADSPPGVVSFCGQTFPPTPQRSLATMNL